MVLLPTYEVVGRELGRDVKTVDDLRAVIKNQKVYCLPKFDEVFKLIQGQVVVFMGAGNIDKEVRKYFVSKLFK